MFPGIFPLGALIAFFVGVDATLPFPLPSSALQYRQWAQKRPRRRESPMRSYCLPWPPCTARLFPSDIGGQYALPCRRCLQWKDQSSTMQTPSVMSRPLWADERTDQGTRAWIRWTSWLPHGRDCKLLTITETQRPSLYRSQHPASRNMSPEDDYRQHECHPFC